MAREEEILHTDACLGVALVRCGDITTHVPLVEIMNRPLDDLIQRTFSAAEWCIHCQNHQHVRHMEPEGEGYVSRTERYCRLLSDDPGAVPCQAVLYGQDRVSNPESLSEVLQDYATDGELARALADLFANRRDDFLVRRVFNQLTALAANPEGPL